MMTRDEALLRVAALAATADGRDGEEERAALEDYAHHHLRSGGVAAARESVARALAAAREGPEDAVLQDAIAALPEHADRMEALEVACTVTGSDHSLGVREASFLNRLRDALGLRSTDVARIVRRG